MDEFVITRMSTGITERIYIYIHAYVCVSQAGSGRGFA
jgi:hypothetical protein